MVDLTEVDKSSHGNMLLGSFDELLYYELLYTDFRPTCTE